MRRKGKRTKGIEQAHSFDGMSRVNANAAGVDIGAEEIVVCVAADEKTQLVRGFGNYTIDLQKIGDWLKEHKVKTGEYTKKCVKSQPTGGTHDPQHTRTKNRHPQPAARENPAKHPASLH